MARKLDAQGEEILDDVRTHCKNAFVGLSFAAEPIRAGFGYLSSFIREKYDKMIVQHTKAYKRLIILLLSNHCC